MAVAAKLDYGFDMVEALGGAYNSKMHSGGPAPSAKKAIEA
jgi:hypothetical protein